MTTLPQTVEFTAPYEIALHHLTDWVRKGYRVTHFDNVHPTLLATVVLVRGDACPVILATPY